ncbi:MAG TPA: hypothetical protein VJ204_01280 [Solirubrobacterales bacterium]|jgi:hypothetical protein|nr:hypothetical protein [Solirubrobacterales bacterium]
MDDAIAVYHEASEANDLDRILTTLTPDCEVVSPISGHMVFRGAKDLRVLLGAVYSTTRGMRWTEEVGEGAARVLIGEFKVGPLRMTDAMAFDLAPDGRIRRIRPHLRPLLATTFFAMALGLKVGMHPGVVFRALRG